MGNISSTSKRLAEQNQLIIEQNKTIQRLMEQLNRYQPKAVPDIIALTEEHKQQMIVQARHELGLDIENNINIAVVGNSGVGKSSLVNALLGKQNKDPGAAPVGVTETTLKRDKYVHPKYSKIVLWDIPGAGTVRVKTETYITDNKLWGFDALLIVSAGRFLEIDFQVCNALRQYNVPCAFVRTKADNDLKSLVTDGKADTMLKASDILRHAVQTDIHSQIKSAKPTMSGILFYIVCARAVRDIENPKSTAYVYHDEDTDTKDVSLKGMDETALVHFILNTIHPRLATS